MCTNINENSNNENSRENVWLNDSIVVIVVAGAAAAAAVAVAVVVDNEKKTVFYVYDIEEKRMLKMRLKHSDVNEY
mgnify:FL=1